MKNNPKVIQRQQNIIRTIGLLIFFIISKHTFSQNEKLNGKYSHLEQLQDYYTVYYFDGSSTFEYHTGGCLGDEYFGKGTYKIKDKLLILNYNKTEPIKLGHHVSKIWTNDSTAIDIQFKFFDFENRPIPFVNVTYKDSLSKNGYNGIAANKEGTAKLSLIKENEEFEMKISSVGFSQYKFTVGKKYNYSISIYLQNEGNGLPIRNQMDTLKIGEMTSKYFTVKNKNGSVTTWRKREN